MVTSTPEGYQYAPVLLGGAPVPDPDGHQPQAAVDQTAPPLPSLGFPPSVPHQRTGESEAAVPYL